MLGLAQSALWKCPAFSHSQSADCKETPAWFSFHPPMLRPPHHTDGPVSGEHHCSGAPGSVLDGQSFPAEMQNGLIVCVLAFFLFINERACESEKKTFYLYSYKYLLKVAGKILHLCNLFFQLASCFINVTLLR